MTDTAAPRSSPRGPVADLARASGLAAARARIALGSRPLGHLHLALRALDSGGRRAPVALAFAVSSVGDAVIVRRLLEPSYLPGPMQWVAEALDTATWSALVRRPVSLAAPLAVNAQPSAVEAGYRVGTGPADVPRYGGSPGWPPASPADTARAVGRLVAPIALSAAAGVAVRRAQGLPPNPADLLWSIGMGMVGLLTARHRSRLQRAARREWAELTHPRIDHEVRAAVADLVTASSPAHDFTKTLLVLEDAGAPGAGEVARRHLARPAEIVSEPAAGRMLGHVVRGARIEPPDAGRLLISDEHAETVRRFLAAATDTSSDLGPTSVRVVAMPDGALLLAYGGDELELRSDPPDYRARLSPTSSMFVLSAALRASDLLPVFRSLPSPALFAAIACDLVGAVRFWRRPPADEDMALLVGLTLAGCGIGFVGAASGRATVVNADGEPHLPGISIVQGAAVVLAAHWGRLGRGSAALPLVVAGFLAVSLRRTRPSAVLWAESLTLLGQSLVSMWRLAELVDIESDVFVQSLHDEFTERRAVARHRALAAELARYEAELRVAEDALATLGDALDADSRALVESECGALRDWLDERRQAFGFG